jgi:hypothetical protein
MLTLRPSAQAADISIGGSVQFNWWISAWNNGKLILRSPDLMNVPVSN